MPRLPLWRATPCVALLLTALGGTLASAAPAQASPTLDGCAVSLTGTVYTLTDDCTITSELYVPVGYSLDGADHTLTAVGTSWGDYGIVRLGDGQNSGHSDLANLTVVDDATAPSSRFPTTISTAVNVTDVESTVAHVHVTTGTSPGVKLNSGVDSWTTTENTVTLSDVHVAGAVNAGFFAASGGGPLDLRISDSSAALSLPQGTGAVIYQVHSVEITCTTLTNTQPSNSSAININQSDTPALLGQNDFGTPDNWASDVAGPYAAAPTRACASTSTPTPMPTPTPTPTPTPAAPQHRTVTASGTPHRVAWHHGVRFSGRVTPAQPGARVRLERLQDHHWVVARTATENGQGRYALTWRPHHRGTKTLRVVLAPQPGHAATASRRLHIHVR